LAAHRRREIADPGLRPAAVVVPLVPDTAGLSVLLTRRTDDVEHHKGEICFPGGRVDPGDADHLAAALRETWEEVGVHPEHLQVLGSLDDFVSITGYRVRPFAALLDRLDYPYAPEPREVDELLVIPIHHLLESAHHRMEEHARGELRHRFHWQGRVVWGLTAAILHHFLRVALPRGTGP
ncbi:MAG TPA: CoA pyrophosphatase, partial [Deferrisomatales bacterium]|nr:CoA pyrophosphatase [Deferrisomatales bacterium]